MKRIRILFNTTLITCVILFAPGICNAQMVNNASTDDQTISDLKGELETLNEELETITKKVEGLICELEYLTIKLKTSTSKEEKSTLADLIQNRKEQIDEHETSYSFIISNLNRIFKTMKDMEALGTAADQGS